METSSFTTTSDLVVLKDCIARKVVDYYISNPPKAEQIVHTQAVANYTRLIAVGEGLSSREVELQEMAAWLHDVGCPNARRLHGSSKPVYQQEEGCKLVAEWLRDVQGLTSDEKQWLADTVGAHHRIRASERLHFEPLFEADLIVNFIEGYYQAEDIPAFFEKMMKTRTGRELYRGILMG